LGDGILKLALLDILLRIGENFLLIEAEQCHKSVELQTLVSPTKLRTEPDGRWGLLPGTGRGVICHIGRWPTGQGQLYVWTSWKAWLPRVTERECTEGLLRKRVGRNRWTRSGKSCAQCLPCSLSAGDVSVLVRMIHGSRLRNGRQVGS